MKLDAKLCALLSDFFLDIAKAYFIATFITPVVEKTSFWDGLFLLTKGIVGVSILLWVAWQLTKLEKYYE
jgi:hypothetical protein